MKVASWQLVIRIILLLVVILHAAIPSQSREIDTTLIRRLLESRPELFSGILGHPSQKEVQVLYTHFLAAVVQSNNDEVYNDNKYEYRNICFPFMKNLGRIVYDFELHRGKKRVPDLSQFEKYR